jgi:signal transduction histidine kinase
MINCVQYSYDGNVKIILALNNPFLQIEYLNKGKPINPDEQQYLFQHFFRGENSKGKRGFGLGLVMVHKILALHNGQINYSVDDTDTNKFSLLLPLS